MFCPFLHLFTSAASAKRRSPSTGSFVFFFSNNSVSSLRSQRRRNETKSFDQQLASVLHHLRLFVFPSEFETMPLVLVVEEVTKEERPLGLLQVPGVILCETDRLSNCDFYLELRPEGCPDFNKGFDSKIVVDELLMRWSVTIVQSKEDESTVDMKVQKYTIPYRWSLKNMLVVFQLSSEDIMQLGAHVERKGKEIAE